mgnify:CR=1 FL=1
MALKSAYKTHQQDLLLSYLSKTNGKHFTAEDVRNHFEKKGISIGCATIYRQLEKFVGQGKVLKFFIDEHSAACFEYIGEDSNNSKEQHFHLKCEKCGRLSHLECEELVQLKEHLTDEHGFILNPCRTVFYGLCSECAKEKNAK